MNYGRFRTVRGGAADRASDLDLLIVVPRAIDAAAVLAALNGLPHLEGAAAGEARAREWFRAEVKDISWLGTVFSEKLVMWRHGEDPALRNEDAEAAYGLSVHLITPDQLSWLTLGEKKRHGGQSARQLWHLRNTAPDPAERHRTCDGREMRLPRAVLPTDGGWLTQSFAIHFVNNRMSLGLLPTFVLPSPCVIWDPADAPLHRAANRFRQMLEARVVQETARAPGAPAHVTHWHVRGRHART